MFPYTAIMQCSHTHTYNYMVKWVHHMHTMYTPKPYIQKRSKSNTANLHSTCNVCIRTLLMSTISNPLLIHPPTYIYTPHTQCTHTHTCTYMHMHTHTHTHTHTCTQRGKAGLVINISLCIGYTIYLYIAYIRPQPLGCLGSSVVRAPV